MGKPTKVIAERSQQTINASPNNLAIASPTTSLEMLVGICYTIKIESVILQAHGTPLYHVTQEYSKISYLFPQGSKA